MKTVLQKPTNLKLGILSTELPITLTALKRTAVSTGQWVFSFQIVGESHLVRIEHRGALILQEVLACIDVAAAHCVDCHDFGDRAAYRYKQRDYAVAVSFLDRPEWTLPPADSRACLEVEFPTVYGHSPVTRIQWEVTAGAVRWWTLHLYPEPEHLTRVQSRSEFRCR
jgi:Protein of unknown function DUF2617